MMNGVLAGRYELRDSLGGGGTSLVYRARDRQTDRDVAVKVLRPDFAAQPAVRQRFLAEGDLVRHLDDPGIVRVLEVGQEADRPFLVMELATGTTLRRVLDAHGPMSIPAACSIILPLTRALDRAHAAGIVHRDVKPENIFVDGWKVKLGDFGNARVVSLASVTGASLTWGTPEYVAPELFSRGRADPRSDFYAVGVLLYEMLTGRRPWSRAEGLARIGAPAALAPRPAPTGAGERIDRLIADLLSASAGDRPASGHELRARLTGDQDPEPVPQTTCLACGAQRPDDVPVCLTCGNKGLELPAEVEGAWRVVLNHLDDDLAATDKLLRVIGPLSEPSTRSLLFLTGPRQLYSDDELARGTDFPAALFGDLSEAAAHVIAGLFRDHGFDVTAVRMRDAGSLYFRRPTKLMTLHLLFAGALAGTAVERISGNIPAGLVAAGTVSALAFAARFRARRLRAAGMPPLFELRRQLAPVPAADQVLAQARSALNRIRAPEVRALLTDISTEIYRLSRRTRTTTALLTRLESVTERLDALDEALAGSSEGEIMSALARTDRAAAAPGADRLAVQATRRDLEATLQRRHAAEQDRARLSAKLCDLLGLLRGAARNAPQPTTTAAPEDGAVEAATAEVEALLAAMPAVRS